MNKNAVYKLRLVFISLFGLVILSYSLFQGWKLITGPVVDIYYPENGATYTGALVEVSGKARNVAYLSLDGKQIFTDKEGYFKEKLLLLPGYNIIQVDGQDKFQGSTKKIIQVILKEK